MNFSKLPSLALAALISSSDAAPVAAESSTGATQNSERAAVTPPSAADAADTRTVNRYLDVGAYVQMEHKSTVDSEFNNDDADGFAFRNARLTAIGRTPMYGKFGTRLRFEFDAADGFSVKDLFASAVYGDDLIALDIGQFKVPFSLLELTSDSQTQLVITRRGEISARRLLLGRDRGVRLRGDVPLPLGEFFVRYWFSITNGDGDNDVYNQDSKYLYAGRLEIAPLGRLSDGEPDLDNSPIQFSVGGSFTHTAEVGNNDFGTIGYAAANETRFSGDARLKFRGLSLRGEYLHIQQKKDADHLGIKRNGFYAQLGYVFPIPIPPQFEVVARIQQVELNDKSDGYETVQGTRTFSLQDNAKTRKLEFGLNAYIFKQQLKLCAEYHITTLLEGLNKADGEKLFGNEFLLSTQFGWF